MRLVASNRFPIKLYALIICAYTCAILINITSSACKDKNSSKKAIKEGGGLALLCRALAMSRERREFVRVLHSNAEGQPRSKIKPSKKGGRKVGDCTWKPATHYRLDCLAQYRSHRPYRYRPRGHGWFHNRGDKRIPPKCIRNSVCGKLSRRFPSYLLGKHRPADRSTQPVGTARAIRGEGFIGAISGSTPREFIATPSPLLRHLRRERRSD